ncbi:diguanylate cyclase [Marinobacter sp. S6332]|uniref:diguanylate cyclase domain-containing protein n=1 Tax=Marinobacter sp. S6332 TaxID=2926403 RepID=UPI001FF2EBEA|nr:diguanylate cyclase [Marinobacter sp. S6332]MCK0163018.1 diguanylate cyclase [Marinobacter sp. S6332]
MDVSTEAQTGFIESGYWVSGYLFWSVPLILLALLLAGAWCLLRYRHAMKAQNLLVQELREGADSFRYLVETAHEGIAVVQNTRLVYLNPRMCEMSGYDEAELKELPSFMPLIHPSARDEMMANYQRRVAGEEAPKRYESLFLRKDGSSYPIEISGAAIVWGGQPATLNMLTDISDRKAAEEKILYLAHHDSLTGLVNRSVLRERLQHTIGLARRSRDPFAVLFIDLNAFKQVNDTHGHEVGDVLLQQVSQRIKKQLRDTDTFARIGGDEFVVLLPQIKGNQDVKQIMTRIEETMAKQFHIQQHKLHCHVSQGAAQYPEDGTSVQALLRQADKNMYANKCSYYESSNSNPPE